ncbi:MAG: hypothetical protein RR327_00665 [Clostridia bacterium]
MNEQQNCCNGSGQCPDCDCPVFINETFVESDCESLHAVAKSTLMALHSLDELIKHIKVESEIYPFVIDQIDAYRELNGKMEDAFAIIDEPLEKVKVFNDFMLSGSIKMNTMIDATDSHIAEMLIQGTTMGIIEITKTINENDEKLSKSCKELLYDILFAMNSFIADMKKFL